MAWDPHECSGVWIESGDIPFDVMSGALEKLQKVFLERWGRPPYLAELLYPLLFLAEMPTNRPVADEQLPSMEALISFVGGLTPAEHIEPGDFEAAFEEDSDDCLVFSRSGNWSRESMVVRVEVLQPEDGGIVCRYETLSPGITDRMAHCLIRDCVLRCLYKTDLTDPDLSLRFERRPPCGAT